LSLGPGTVESRIIVTKNLTFTTGILVDTIQGVFSVSETDIQPPLNTLTPVKAEFIQGEFYMNDKLVIMLNMKRISSSKEMQI